ncbi:photosystem reaction center subunit H [Modestobacter sp. VKM Ac-2676]|nr:photosystem reaction center subunit H [Modestobacter sp. VKM Ac-2676]
MITEQDIHTVIGTTAVDADGDKLGKVGQVYLDDSTGRPEWATVSTGLFGTSETFVPLADAQLADGALRVPYQKAKVKDAPRMDADAGHLSPDEEAELYRYYGVGTGTETVGRTHGTAGFDDTTAGRTTDTNRQDTNRHGTTGHDTSGPTTDDAMTRSEEQLRVGTQQVESGKARLRKFVVTENVTTTVPVSHEEVRLEREPITDANREAALDGPAISEEEHEVTLHAERPVVAKETVPVERVRLDTETVTGQETVSDSVRKEQIEADTDGRSEGRSTR